MLFIEAEISKINPFKSALRSIKADGESHQRSITKAASVKKQLFSMDDFKAFT